MQAIVGQCLSRLVMLVGEDVDLVGARSGAKLWLDTRSKYRTSGGLSIRTYHNIYPGTLPPSLVLLYPFFFLCSSMLCSSHQFSLCGCLPPPSLSSSPSSYSHLTFVLGADSYLLCLPLCLRLSLTAGLMLVLGLI